MLQNLNVELYDCLMILAEMNDTAGVNLVYVNCEVSKCSLQHTKRSFYRTATGCD